MWLFRAKPTGDRRLRPKARTHFRISSLEPAAAWTQRACPQIRKRYFQSNRARQSLCEDSSTDLSMSAGALASKLNFPGIFRATARVSKRIRVFSFRPRVSKRVLGPAVTVRERTQKLRKHETGGSNSAQALKSRDWPVIYAGAIRPPLYSRRVHSSSAISAFSSVTSASVEPLESTLRRVIQEELRKTS